MINSSSNGVDCAMFAELFSKLWVTQEGLPFTLLEGSSVGSHEILHICGTLFHIFELLAIENLLENIVHIQWMEWFFDWLLVS